MSERITHTAGAALGWLVVLGVVAKLAPEAGREARELASELVQSVRTRFRRRSGGPDDLARQVREMAPPRTTW
jgi:hypothetical protein